jgi:hypothetical protein
VKTTKAYVHPVTGILTDTSYLADFASIARAYEDVTQALADLRTPAATVKAVAEMAAGLVAYATRGPELVRLVLVRRPDGLWRTEAHSCGLPLPKPCDIAPGSGLSAVLRAVSDLRSWGVHVEDGVPCVWAVARPPRARESVISRAHSRRTLIGVG